MGENKQSPDWRAIATIIAALIAGLATVVAAYLAIYLPHQYQVQATQTAEARLTVAAVLIAPSPTPTIPAEPLARITNLEDRDAVPQMMTLIGDYRADLTDAIWVFVQDPNKLYYPQSMDPCNGESTPKKDGKWEIRIGVGVADSSGLYNLVLTIANPQVDEYLADALQNSCKRGGSFDGYSKLLPGLTEVQRLEVARRPAASLADANGPMPMPPDAGLPGQLTVAGFGNGGAVNPEEIVSGTASGVGDSKVWVLVFTNYGRWYPQSINPCNHVHTKQTDGQWQAKAVFGGEKDSGQPFDVAVVVANAEADAFFDTHQWDWCQNNHYPGLLTIDLPKGLSMKYHSRVIRK